jgi:hypothetical protein
VRVTLVVALAEPVVELPDVPVPDVLPLVLPVVPLVLDPDVLPGVPDVEPLVDPAIEPLVWAPPAASLRMRSIAAMCVSAFPDALDVCVLP